MIILVDILRRAKVDVVVASVEKSKKIVASQQTKVIADKLIEEASDSTFDLVVLPVSLISTFFFIDDTVAYNFPTFSSSLYQLTSI